MFEEKFRFRATAYKFVAQLFTLVLLFYPFYLTAAEPEATDLEQQIKHLDETLWVKEVQAQKYEQTFIRLWDEFRPSLDKFGVLKSLGFETLKLGSPGKAVNYDLDVIATRWDGEPKTLTREQWAALLDSLESQGFQILECEFHHPKFEIDADKNARSGISVLFHIARPLRNERYVIKGEIQVQWSAAADPHGNFIPKSIDATGLTITQRTGNPGFAKVKSWEAGELGKSPAQLQYRAGPEPVIAYDLDGDGLSEVVLLGWNLLFRNRGNGRFDKEELIPDLPHSIVGGIIADFDGDGLPDLICQPENSYLYFYAGLPGGRFNPAGRKIEATGKPLNQALCICAGDVDGDGALDLWVTQYKWIYAQGQMPTPYYDANDSNPSYLLHNDGHANFTDVTEQAGLAKKRFRRTYSSSLVDLNGDGLLDLLVSSDFCGVDLYYNDGHGHFTDVTSTVLDETKLFGMSHTFGDFNGDGKLDFFVTGMGSTTARRLEFMKLGRAEFPEHNAMRMRMGYGNRMYLAGGDGKYHEPIFKDKVARTGWSWGSSTLDFNNDGYPDIYVANGLQSGISSKDYCTEYWRHDMYIQSANPDPKLDLLFSKRLKELSNKSISWNGFEHDFLLMNVGGKDFVNVGFLMNVAYEFDARAVVSDDVDLDGRPDLIVSQYGLRGESAVHLAMNRLETDNNWIGVQLREEGGGYSPIGAKITVVTPARNLVNQVVTGDSFRSQHSNTKHFGLGKETQVDYIEVKWLNGKTKRIEKPAINKYFYIKPDK